MFCYPITNFIILLQTRKSSIYSQAELEALKAKQGGVLIEGVYPNGARAYYGFGI